MPVPKLYNFLKKIKDEGILIILQKVGLNHIKEIPFTFNSIAYHSNCISTVSYEHRKTNNKNAFTNISARHLCLRQHFGSRGSLSTSASSTSTLSSPTFEFEGLVINFDVNDFAFANISARRARR